MVAAGLLAACAEPASRPGAAVKATPATAAPASGTANTAKQPEELPFEYEDDPVYRLLIAEFAGQRGHLDTAVRQYQALAKNLRDVDLAQRATRIAVFARDDAAALAAAKVWVELAPLDMEARQIIAAMFIRHGDADSAFTHLEYILEHDHEEPGNRLRMIANLLGREEDRATALDVMGRLLERFENNSDALLAYALLAIRAEKLPEAEQAMNQIAAQAELGTNVAMAYLAVLQKQDKLPKALDWLDHVLTLNPKQSGLRLLYARLLADASRFEQARLQFNVLSDESPQNADILFALGLLNLQANRTDAARENFNRLVELDERRDEAHFYLGQIAEARSETAAALKHYESVEDGSNYFPAQLRHAIVTAQTGAVDKAVAFLGDVTTTDSKQAYELARVRGEILTEHQRYAEAMAVYNDALGEDGYDTDLLYTRAMLAEKMGEIPLVEADLRRIIETEPENAQALNALGYTLADRTERYDEALELIEKALELSPSDFFILDSMGWVLYRLGRLDEAIDYLEQARELRNDPEVAAHLGEVLWVKGEHDAARDVWESALKDTPNDQKLLDVIERLAP